MSRFSLLCEVAPVTPLSTTASAQWDPSDPLDDLYPAGGGLIGFLCAIAMSYIVDQYDNLFI